MGLTLFRYIFRDLVKVFLLAAASLAGILSFAGLLRPLTERGLGAEEAVRILIWLMPAMLSYSLPVAALFATTFVYGRLSADNESTAAKAAGIPASPAGLLLPATMLAALLGLVSFGALCFLVPAANLQVEQTVWSNLARLAANNINRTSRIQFHTDQGGITVFASRATLPTEEELAAARARAIAEAGGDESAVGVSEDVQVVQLENAYIVRYADAMLGEDVVRVPDEIYSARNATVYIDPPAYARDRGDRLIDVEEAFDQTALSFDQFTVTVVLEDGLKFPRRLGVEAGQTITATAPNARPTVAAAQVTQFGPIRRDTPVRMNPKFMDVRELRALLENPELARRILELVHRYARGDQRSGYLRHLSEAAAEDGLAMQDVGGSTLRFSADGEGQLEDERLTYTGVPVRFVQMRDVGDGRTERIEIEADAATVEAEPLSDPETGQPRLLLVFTFPDASVTIDGRTSAGRSIERRAVIPMPDNLAALPTLSARQYLAGEAIALGGTRPDADFAKYLLGKLASQTAGVVGELHARAAFVAACVILPLLGAGLGLMFRSGNFLTAFAVSTIPAAVCVLMIVVGQQVIENVGDVSDRELANPKLLRPSPGGIAFIWSGDALVAAGGAVLLWRLRQR